MSSSKEMLLFKQSLETICGEANEAARLSELVLEGESLDIVRRELARIIEVVELKIIPCCGDT